MVIDNLRLKLNMEVDSEFFASIVTILYFCGTAVRFFFTNTIGRMGYDYLTDYIYAGLLLGFMFICIFSSRTKQKFFLAFLIVFVIVLLYFGATLAVHPEYAEYYQRETVGIWDELFSPVTGCIYALLVVLLCGRVELLWRNLKCCAWINLVFYTMIIISRDGNWSGYSASGEAITMTYDLGVGYSVMFVTCILLCSYLEKKKKRDLLGVSFSLFLVLNNGSRGALVCFGICFILVVAFKNNLRQWNTKQKMRICILFILVICFIQNFDEIVRCLGTLLIQLGVQSRTILAMAAGTLTADNGRSLITERAMAAISESGLFGLGAFGDRPFIAPYYWWGYCHNIILEFLCDFGVVFGTVLLGLLAAWMIRTLLKPTSSAYRYVYIVFLSMSGKLILSDTFWGYPYFWALLGVMVMSRYYGEAEALERL